MRQVIHDHDPTWHLVARQPLACVGTYSIRVDSDAGHRHNGHNDLLARVAGCRDADDGEVLDLREVPKDVLDLRGIDVETAGDDQLLDPVDNADEAVPVRDRDVTSSQPAAGQEHRSGLLRAVPVPG